MITSLFSYAHWQFAYHLQRKSIHILCALFKLGCCGVAGILYYVLDVSPCQRNDVQTLPPVLQGASSPLMVMHQRFTFWCRLSIFSCLCFLVSYPRNHCQIQQCEASPLFLDFTSHSWGCCWGPPTQYTLLSSQVTRCLEQLQYLILSQLTCDYCHMLIILDPIKYHYSCFI